MGQKPMGIGILGAGGIAALSHLPEMEQIPEMRVVHLAGRTVSRLETLQARYGIDRISTDWESLLADPEVEGVIISLPHPLHAAAGLAALRAGKHVLMQKPLCASMEEANALVEVAARRPEQIVYVLPHASGTIRTMKRMIDAGRLGTISGAAARHSHGGPEVYYAEVADAFGEERRTEDLWFFDPKQASVGALFDMGVYAVANLVYLLGRVVSVSARLRTIAKPTPLEDTATLILEFASGALGTAETGWCDPARTSFTRVHGTEGKLLAPGSQDAPLELWRPSRDDRENAPLECMHPEPGIEVNAHLRWFACIREGRQPDFCTLARARHITEVLLAALESSKTGKEVTVRSDPEG